MAFHVSCPITCRKICNCKLGFPPDLRTWKSRDEFVKAAASVQALFNDPALIYGKKDENVQVLVPKVGGGGGGDVAVVAVADYAKRFESGFTKNVVGDEQGLSNAKVMCRLCFSAENEGSGRARKMLSCKSCSKKYHSSCVKSWAQNRDLFHWSSWTCPSCRSCEVCHKNGDPNKLMFCKRCDDAYHCYCQQPAHKNVSSGPYLCPKHTKCHSCASTVPGNGLSVRWFLGYTCCDACGRLFVKGNYCPVCLKVYRDSESTPMVCCDVCQRWVHCHCDGISDEKYMQFQVDNNLQYRCATCRGECYKVRDLEDAVQELWRRRDKADRELTASLRAAAGLPTQEEIFSVQPYSDDDDDPPLAKNEHGRSLKFSLKGIVDKAPKKKSSSKNSVKKKGYNALSFGRTEQLINSHTDAQSAGFIADDKFKDVDVQSSRSTEFEIAGSLNDVVWSSNQARHHKNSLVKTDRLSRDKMNNRRSHGVDTKEQMGKSSDRSINTKGPKLVIHLGARNKNVTSSPRSDAANLHPGQDVITSNDSEDMFRHRANGKPLNRSKFSDLKGDTLDHDDQNRLRLRGKEGSTIKIRKLNPEIPDAKPRVSFGKRSETPSLRGQEAPDGLNESNKTKELKPLLRLKFKNPYADNQTSLAQSREDDKSSIKGQRSKRKRPSPLIGDPLFAEEYEGADCSSDEDLEEIMDANWIIQKLGKDAIGKSVEVHQRSNHTWHKGTVHEVFEGTSVVSVTLDDGKTSNVDLGKQGIRFYSQKRRW